MGLALHGCGPSVRTVLADPKEQPYVLDPSRPIEVLGVAEPTPEGAVTVGTVKIGDTGFSTSCGWERVLSEARNEARKAGGDLLKLTSHVPPNFGSSCHRITALILRADPAVMAALALRKEAVVDTTWDHAML